MESSGANHDRLRKCQSELQLRIVDRAERRPNCPRDRDDCRVLLLSNDNELLQPHHISILSLHDDYNSGSRTRGGGDELGQLFNGIQNHSRGERWCPHTNRGLLCHHQRGREADEGPRGRSGGVAGGYELFGRRNKHAVAMTTIYLYASSAGSARRVHPPTTPRFAQLLHVEFARMTRESFGASLAVANMSSCTTD